LYFGNTGGNLFKLNIADSLTSSWIPKLLFKGITGSQPIYLAPSISYDQCYKLWVHFGTGDRNITQSAPTGQFIGIMDNTSITYPLTTATTTPVLQQLTWTRGIAPAPDTMSSTPDKTKSGWYFDFLDDKETFFDPDPVVIPDKNIPYLYFNTYQPKSTVSGTDPCGSGGNMHVYSIMLPYCFSNGDLLISGEREEARIAGGGMVDDGYLQYKNTAVTGSITTKEFEKYTLQYPGGVFYFKEIIR
jgi:Tfp pilus tip-associated adhesin PilY1